MKTDPRFVQWIGASCVAKVSASDELFVQCDRLKPKFINYNEHLAQVKKSLIEEAKTDELVDLSIEQLAEIEKESLKRVKRDRFQMLDGGMRLICEKATFTI